MDTQILFKNMLAKDNIRDYADKKISKLDKYLANISSIKLELIKEKTKSRQNTYTAQATLNINGFIIRGENHDENIKAAIDEVVDKMERLITKYKKRYEVNKGRTNESIRIPAPESDMADTDNENVAVVREKKFVIKPMTIEQAIDQMDFIGHDFFIFANIDDKSVNVVYHRKNGMYGLILPELG